MPKKLILPGPQSPKGRLTILVPRGYEDRPTGGCALCGVPFFRDRDVKQHLASPGHAEMVERAREARGRRDQRLAIMRHPDPEVAEHMAGVGRRMLREGRLTVKPSERAGF